MKGINSEFCARVRQLRRDNGISQSELASAIGCKQSAISMFEKGDPTKLSDDAVERLAERFSLKIENYRSEKPALPARQAPMPSRGFCPNSACPTNKAYEVEGHVLYLPDRLRADPAGGKFCAFCGEVLERRCTNCGAPVHDGAICSFCASPYIVADCQSSQGG